MRKHADRCDNPHPHSRDGVITPGVKPGDFYRQRSDWDSLLVFAHETAARRGLKTSYQELLPNSPMCKELSVTGSPISPVVSAV